MAKLSAEITAEKTMPTRDEYVATLKNQLDKWNAEIGHWENKAAAAKDELRKSYRAQLEKIKAKREKALYTLKLVEGASAAAWGDLRWGLDDAWDRLHDAMKEARMHFERPPASQAPPPVEPRRPTY
jgi:hypothetical protein